MYVLYLLDKPIILAFISGIIQSWVFKIVSICDMFVVHGIAVKETGNISFSVLPDFFFIVKISRQCQT
jgi:hypothetical protein